MKSPLLPLLPPPPSWLLSATASFISASTIPVLLQKHNPDIKTSLSTYLNLRRRARLVLRWLTMSGFNSQYVTSHPGQLSLLSLRDWQIRTSCSWEGKGRYGSFCWRMNAGCADKTKIPWEHMPYLRALEVCSWQDAIRIHVCLTLPISVKCIHACKNNCNFLHIQGSCQQLCRDTH